MLVTIVAPESSILSNEEKDFYDRGLEMNNSLKLRGRCIERESGGGSYPGYIQNEAPFFYQKILQIFFGVKSESFFSVKTKTINIQRKEQNKKCHSRLEDRGLGHGLRE